MQGKIVLPSTTETAFNCPHCDVLTTQHWFTVHANRLDGKERTPAAQNEAMKAALMEISRGSSGIPDENVARCIEEMERGDLSLYQKNQGSYVSYDTRNLSFSQCYNCNKIAVWVHESLVFPPQKEGAQPNADLSEDIIHDFEEARSILNLSPRGAAALLRLCIQKLCGFLGEKGKNINDDIGSLVSKGLNPVVQKSLDAVRVIGNEAVHPGSLDLKDDRDTALQLFDLVNLIADQMITNPKKVDEVYKKVPESKRREIDARNERVAKKSE